MLNGYKIAALCMAKVSEDENTKLVQALNSSLTAAGYRLFIYNTCTHLFWNTPSNDGERTVFELIDFNVTDAVIIIEEMLKDKDALKNVVPKAQELDIPVISVGGSREGCIKVAFDYEEGFEQVVRHLTDAHGCRNFHYMAGNKGNEFSMRRQQVMEKVLAEKNIPFDESCVSYGDFWSEPARIAAEKLVADNNIPDAIVCANDVMAITVCSVFKKHGYSIPDDLIVTGFDGIDDASFFKPGITSSRYSYVKLADKITELLENYGIEGITHKTHYVGLEFLPNESCGCNAVETVNPTEYIISLNSRFHRYQNEECQINEHLAAIYCCESINEVYHEMKKLNFYGIYCMLNKECIDETVNPMYVPESSSFSDEMCWLFRYESDDFLPCSFEKKNILPNMEYILELKNPLIFNSLYFRNIPLGYICCFFDPIPNEYCRIPQMVNGLNIAIGGFRNMRYQRYITNRIDIMAKRDMLTGLFNRKGFAAVLSEKAHDFRSGAAVISADLDGLKYINDTFGHSEGDNAISTAARALAKCCPEESICARFGGDEFAAVTADITAASEIKNAIAIYLDHYNETSGKPYKVAISTGIYICEFDGKMSTFEAMLKEADSLMYSEKNGRRQAAINQETYPEGNFPFTARYR